MRSGAGFLILWYAGVLKVFQQLGIYKPLNPPRVAGISSGALTSAAICSGTTAEQFHHTVRAPRAGALWGRRASEWRRTLLGAAQLLRAARTPPKPRAGFGPDANGESTRATGLPTPPPPPRPPR
jgi:predicted acylesterase/phospholipase RssA